MRIEADASERLALVLQTLSPVADIVEQRVEGAQAPNWCSRRGWVDYLLAMSQVTLQRAEAEGLAAVLEAAPDAPADLCELAQAVQAGISLPRITVERTVLSSRAARSVSARKREQLGLLLGALGPMAAHAARIVDVGAGRGAFTRLAAGSFGREALGIERSAERVAFAAARVRADVVEPALPQPQFRASDACRDGLGLSAGDLAVGLHACGELGDELVRAAAEAGCDTALISCCLQKIAAPARRSLSRLAADTTFPRGILGLTNQTSQPLGVEATLERTLSARQVRYALLQLLRARGCALEPGAEMSGINRRRAHAGLRAVAELALARRGLAPATDAELAAHEARAAHDFQLVRRLSLPRSMLARLVEVSITLDRAAHLEEHGFQTCVATLCERAVTPRNLAVFASRDGSRLPPLETAGAH